MRKQLHTYCLLYVLCTAGMVYADQPSVTPAQYKQIERYVEANSTAYNMDKTLDMLSTTLASRHDFQKSELYDLYTEVSDALYIKDLTQGSLSPTELANVTFTLYLHGESEMGLKCAHLLFKRCGSKAYSNLCGILFRYENFDTAFRFFMTGAGEGDPIAAYNAAYMMYTGWEVYNPETLREEKRKNKEEGLRIARLAIPEIMKMDIITIHPELFIAPTDNTLTLQERLTKPFGHDLE